MGELKFGNIYKITSPSGRVYVGQTFNMNRRMNDYKNLSCSGQKRIYASLRKYGFDAHSFEVLYGGFCSPSELTKLEAHFIAELDSAGKNGLNILKSGAVYLRSSEPRKVTVMSKETRKKISDTHKGKVMTNFSKMKISLNNGMKNPVHVATMRDAMVKAINTPECLSKRSQSLKKLYAEKGHPKSKKVHQFTIEGEFVKEFPSTMEAARQLGTSDGRISDCCRGERKTHRGFKFKYA